MTGKKIGNKKGFNKLTWNILDSYLIFLHRNRNVSIRIGIGHVHRSFAGVSCARALRLNL